MNIYFTSYYPLICTKKGLEAYHKYNLPQYIDGSCRREPDFQHDYPAVTGLCRPGFSKKLSIEDKIIYTTNKRGIGIKKFICIFEVMDKFKSHIDAEKWYKDNNYAIPNNLIVSATNPFPLDKTHQLHNINKRISDPEEVIKIWNNDYQNRANNNPDVAICKIWNNHLNLNNPPDLSNDNMLEIFGRIPATRNPPTLKNNEWNKFQNWLNIFYTKSYI